MSWIGFYTLLSRETYRFIRLFSQTVIPPLVTTLLFILVFGYSLGGYIRTINGFSYILYIIPGLVQLGVISNAYANTSTSLFVAKMERSIENLLVAPLHYLQIVLAFVLGGILRGLAVGCAILITSFLFIPELSLQHPVILFLALVLTSGFFSSLGMITALVSESWDHVSLFSTFLITPLTYLGGTFYSINMLPHFWQQATKLNPVFYCIDLTRFGILGVSDMSPWLSLSVLLFLNTIGIGFCTFLFKKGYRLIN